MCNVGNTLKKTDKVITTDRSGRRSFIRAGSAFLLAGASVSMAQEEERQRSDCDSVGGASGKNPDAARSDSDTGATADRQGCGVKKVPITYLNKGGAKNSV